MLHCQPSKRTRWLENHSKMPATVNSFLDPDETDHQSTGTDPKQSANDMQNTAEEASERLELDDGSDRRTWNLRDDTEGTLMLPVVCVHIYIYIYVCL